MVWSWKSLVKWARGNDRKEKYIWPNNLRIYIATIVNAKVGFTKAMTNMVTQMHKNVWTFHGTFLNKLLIFLEDGRKTTDLFLEKVHLFSLRPWNSLGLAKLGALVLMRCLGSFKKWAVRQLGRKLLERKTVASAYQLFKYSGAEVIIKIVGNINKCFTLIRLLWFYNKSNFCRFIYF